jgi:hypothetical protein
MYVGKCIKKTKLKNTCTLAPAVELDDNTVTQDVTFKDLIFKDLKKKS